MSRAAHVQGILALLVAAGCGDPPPSLEVRVVSVGDVDPLGGAVSVRARLLDPLDLVVAESTFSAAEGTGGFPDPIPFGQLRATIDVIGAGDVVVARGSSRLAGFEGEDATVHVFVGAIDSFWETVDENGAPTTIADGAVLLTATALGDGTVLVAGGARLDDDGGLTSITRDAFLFDPMSGRFEPLPPLNLARAAHTATVLRPDATGRRLVLLAGGLTIVNDQLQGAVTAELYDPVSRRFEIVPSQLAQPRAFHTATLLPDGRVLLAGGMQPVAQALDPVPRIEAITPLAVWGDVAVFTPGASTFSMLDAPLDAPRWAHAATRVDQAGRVLLVGGRAADGSALASTSLYEPAADRFFLGPPLSAPRAETAVVRLSDGELLVVGGVSDPGDSTSVIGNTEIVRPTDGTVAPGPPLAVPRAAAAIAPLSGGRVLVTGGFGIDGTARADAEVLAVGGAARLTQGAPAARAAHATAALPGDLVLLVGGRPARGDGGAVARGEVYVDPIE